MIDNLLYTYDNFSAKEAFFTCTPEETKECIDRGYLPNVLTLLHHLDNIRSLYNAPLFISSLYRGMKHNSQVGGSSTSQHLQGAAVDVLTSYNHFDVADITKLVCKALVYNQEAQTFGQIIVYRNFVHFGLLDTSRPNCDHLNILVCKDPDLKPLYELLKTNKYAVKSWNR